MQQQMSRFKILMMQLGDIWELVNDKSVDYFKFSQFVMALYLCEKVSQGSQVPEAIPPNLKQQCEMFDQQFRVI